MNSIKTFWSPELKKERALRKDEATKMSVWKEQYRVVQEETQVGKDICVCACVSGPTFLWDTELFILCISLECLCWLLRVKENGEGCQRLYPLNGYIAFFI